MGTFENGATYAVSSQRKGNFLGRLLSHSDIWATLEIVDGKATAMLPYNEREKGEEVTVRLSLCSLVKQD